MLTDEELDRLQRLSDAAQKPPWRSFIEGRDHTSGSDFIMTQGEGAERGEDIELHGGTQADQDLIAEARNALPLLIEEIRKARSKPDQP